MYTGAENQAHVKYTHTMEIQDFIQTATEKMDVLMEKFRTSRLNKKLNGVINSIFSDAILVELMRPENYDPGNLDKERKEAVAI